MNKLDIIKEINNIKSKKYECVNLEEYNHKIHLLYKKLSDSNTGLIKQEKQKVPNKLELNLSDDEKIKNVMNNIINFGSHSYLLEKSNVKLLSKKFPLFDLFLIKNNLIIREPNIHYQIQVKPIIGTYNKDELIYKINFLLKLCEIVNNKNNKAIIMIILYDLLFRNFNFCLDHNNFGITIKKKLEEYINEYDIQYFNYISDEHNLEKDIIYKWFEEINGLIVNN
jgi:hypothetical protein